MRFNQWLLFQSNAILLAGEGAEKFAKEHMEESAFAPNEYFVTSYAQSRLEEHLKELNEGCVQYPIL